MQPDPLAGTLASRQTIAVDRNVLDAVFVAPAGAPLISTVLICHGIGETVELWRPVQAMLARAGVASLVFDYSGYGESSGRVCAEQMERDAMAAFRRLQELVPGYQVALLGFSLGSGVACAVQPHLPASRLILCAAFSSFREACGELHLPSRWTPDLWDNEAALRRCQIPVAIVHGGADRLFPVAMAERLGRAAMAGRMMVFPAMTHDGIFADPQEDVWRWVADIL